MLYKKVKMEQIKLSKNIKVDVNIDAISVIINSFDRYSGTIIRGSKN